MRKQSLWSTRLLSNLFPWAETWSVRSTGCAGEEFSNFLQVWIIRSSELKNGLKPLKPALAYLPEGSSIHPSLLVDLEGRLWDPSMLPYIPYYNMSSPESLHNPNIQLTPFEGGLYGDLKPISIFQTPKSRCGPRRARPTHPRGGPGVRSLAVGPLA